MHLLTTIKYEKCTSRVAIFFCRHLSYFGKYPKLFNLFQLNRWMTDCESGHVFIYLTTHICHHDPLSRFLKFVKFLNYTFKLYNYWTTGQLLKIGTQSREYQSDQKFLFAQLNIYQLYHNCTSTDSTTNVHFTNCCPRTFQMRFAQNFVRVDGQ